MGKTRVTTETYPRGFASAMGASVPGLAIPDHDKIEMTYAGSNLVGVKYYATAATAIGMDLRAELKLTYDGSNNLIEVERLS